MPQTFGPIFIFLFRFFVSGDVLSWLNKTEPSSAGRVQLNPFCVFIPLPFIGLWAFKPA